MWRPRRFASASLAKTESSGHITTDATQELKLDGYRAIGVKSAGKVRLFSRNSKPFDKKFAYIAEALRELPDETTVDGEIVALDDAGRPSFNLLQNFVSEAGRIRYFVFDLLCHKGRDLTGLPLIERRKILGTQLSDRDERSRTGDEPGESHLSQLGHSL